MVALAELVDFKGGGTPSKAVESYWGGTIPWASVKDFKSSELTKTTDYITEEGLNNSASNLIPAGNLIVPTRMALGKVAINTIDVAINQDLRALIVKNEELVDKRYLFRFLESKAKYLESEGKGATVKGITQEVLKELEIPLPTLTEQKRIAAILDKADNLHRKNQQAIQLADQFLRAVFLDLFGDPVTNSKGWEVKSLGEITEFENGDRSSNYPSGEDIKNTGILFLNTKNITDGKIAFTNTTFITREKFDSLGRGKLQKNDLVITLRGTLGSCAKFNCDYDTGFINAQLMIIRAGEKVNSDFLHSLLTSIPIQRKLKSIGNGAAVPQLTASQLKLFEVYLPPLTEQLKFRKILNNCQKLGKLSNRAQSDDLFNSLSQKAFAGEL